MSINRNLATFAKDVQTDGSLKGIAVTVTVAGGKFVVDGTSQQDMFIPKGVKYRFDVSDSTNSNHPLRFSTTSDGTHGSGSAYTTGVTTSGTAGSAGAYVEVQLQQDAPDQLYYYCGNHSGMGAGAETAPVAVSSYSDSDVDTHLNTSAASSGQLLGWNGSDYAWVADSDTSGIDNIVEDTSPQLGGSLDVNGQSIVSASNGNISITPNGSGKVIIDGLSHPTADGSANQVLKTDGSGNLSFTTMASGGLGNISEDTSPQLGGDLDVQTNSIVSTSNRNIAITPNGSGKVILDGLSFPTADGSADQVLKTDGSGNLSFVDQATGGGGGNLTAVATGALTDGATVAINADGTVSIIEAPRTQNIGAQSIFDTTQYTETPNAVYHAALNKIVIIYSDRLNNSYYLTGVVGTVSGETISFGTKTTLHSSNSKQIATIYDPVSEKIVVAFGDWGDSGAGKTKVITLAANGSLSVGSATTHGTGTYHYFHDFAYDSGNSQIIMSYRGTSNKGFTSVGSVSGTSISFSSPTYSHNGATFHNKVEYDPVNARVVYAFRRDDVSPTQVATAVGTITQQHIGMAAAVNLRQGEDVDLTYDTNSGKMLLLMQDEVGATEYLGGFVGTVASSGNSISFGSITHIESAKGNTPNAIYDPTSKKILVVYGKDASPYNKRYAYATISGTSVSFSTPANLGTTQKNSGHNPLAYDSSNDRIIFAFTDQDSDNSYDGEAVVWRTPTTGGATLTAENFIGISDGAYANGATATIQTAGSVDDAQSGLTAGQTYYVQAATGGLSTTPDTISVVAGTAISATKLLINPDSDPTITSYTNSDVDSHLNVSGASSGQVLSWNGSDYAWTNDSTSPSLNGTAAGALSNGDMVIINADGTVSAIGTQSVSNAIGSETVFNTGTSGSRYMSSVTDPSSGKIVLFYQDQSNSEYGTAVVGTISGTTISFGTPSVFNTGATSWINAAYHTASSSIVCFYLDETNNGNCNAVIATVSGTSVSFGSEQNVARGAYAEVDYDTVNGKFLLCYSDANDSYKINARVISVSGGTISAGTNARISTDDGTMSPRPVYDANAQKFLISYRGASQYGKCRVATISGTSVSFGTEVEFNSGSTAYLDSTYDASAQKVVIAFSDDGLGGLGRIRAATISGTSVSFGSEQSLNSADINRIEIDYDANAEVLVAVYEKNIGSSLVANRITLSGTTFTVGAEFTLNSGTSDYPHIAYDSNSKRMIAAYRDDGNSNKGTAIIIQNAFSVTRSLTSENFIGVSNAAYADGATATVQIAGAVDDAQSGLTAGQSYYVQADGSLGTSPDTIAVMAGTALSATQLSINPDTNPASYTNTQVDAHLNLSGASSGQVLSYNGSDYAWTDDATGAGSITATASGALANGDMVVLNSDGTVSVVADSTQAFAVGTPATVYSSSIANDPTAVYHSGINKIVAVYRDSSSNTTYAALGTISGTSVTFANQVTFESSHTIDYLATAYDPNSQAVVCSYRKQGNPFYWGAKAMTVSGTTITVGGAKNLASFQPGMCDVVFDSNENRFVFAAINFDQSYRLETVVGTVSGTTITSGSAQTINSAAYGHHMAFDSGSNKVVLVFRDNANSLYGAAKVLTVSNSSNSLSIGSTTYFNSDRSDDPRVAYDVNANKVVVAYEDYNNSEAQTLQVGTVSGTSISFGSKITGFVDHNSNSKTIVYDPDNQNIALFYRRWTASLNDTVYFPVTVSGTSATVGSASTILSSSDQLEAYSTRWVTYDTTANKFLVIFKNDSDSQAQAVVVQSPFDGSTNLTDENFLGVSDGAYSNGATATIQTAGSVDDAQSSLTPAQTYFVQSTGGIGLTPSSPSVVAGTAISATKLLVKSGQPIEKPNTTQVVANGALSDGTKVCVNADGTVSAIAATQQSASAGTEAVYYGGNRWTGGSQGSGYVYGVGMHSNEGIVYDSTNNRVIFLTNDGWYNRITAVVGTISGNTVGSLTETAVNGTNSGSHFSGIYDPDNSKIIVVFRDNDNSNYVTAKVGTVDPSNNTVSFGSNVVVESSAISENPTLAYDTANNKVIVGYYSNALGKVAVGTVSGTSISFGSATAISQGNTYTMALGYDASAGKVVLVSADPWETNGSYGLSYIRVGTVSGTSISFGTAVQIAKLTGQTVRIKSPSVMYDDTNQKCVISYVEDNSNIIARGVSISGTTPSLLSGSSLYSSTSYETVARYDPLSQTFLVAYQVSSAAKYKTFKFNGSAITNIGSEVSMGNPMQYLGARETNDGKFVIYYNESGQSDNEGRYVVVTNAFSQNNLTATNYIGVSDAAYADGATATIQVAGATDDAQSGLTAGQLYYVQNDGTLSTTADSPSVIAGTALSASKLIVKG